MGVFSRPDSPWWWLWLESAPMGAQREKTAIRIGRTTAQRHDSKRLAEDLYHLRMGEIAAKIHRLPIEREAARFRVYAAMYQADTIAHRKGAERERDALARLLAFFGDDLLTAIDRDRVKAYRTHRRQAVSAATVNREVGVLKTMLRDAVPKYLEANPLAGMPQLATVTPKRRLMTPDEEKKLLKVCDPQEYALLVLGMDTLIRQGDLLDVKRSDVEGMWLYVADPKSGEPYEVALSKRSVAALKRVDHDELHYFEKFRRAVNPRDWRGSVRQVLERLCKTADVPFGKSENGITFHWATRRTGATRYLVKKRTPLAVVQKLGNWKKPDVLLEIYAEADRDDLLTAVGQPLPNHSRSKRKSPETLMKRA